MQHITVSYQPKMVVTVTRKGQITIPAASRKHLQMDNQRKLALIIDPDGGVRLRSPAFPIIASLAGAAGLLPERLKDLSWQEIVTIAHEDEAEQSVAQDK